MISTGRVSVLTDLGFGKRSLQRRLHSAGLKDEKISAIFLTHAHSDHIAGVSAFAVERKIPVFATQGTFQELPASETLPRVELMRAGCPVTLGDLCVTPFAISHDAAEPVGFRFEAEGVRGALATDLGEMSSEVAAQLAGCDWLILESNHDENLVRLGPYPWPLKQRLLSPVGHLSNNAVAAFLGGAFDAQARHIFLAHLSRNNNTPELALETAQAALDKRFGPQTPGEALPAEKRALTARLSDSPFCGGLYRNPAGLLEHGGLNGRPCLHLTDQVKPSIVLNL